MHPKTSAKNFEAAGKSRVMNSFHGTAPVSFATAKPKWVPARQSPKTPPPGAEMKAIRPKSITSIAGDITDPPAASTTFVVASASAVAR